jgi:hypothetical protein
MDTLNDIVLKSNIFYNVNKKIFEDNIPINLEFEVITEPTIIMNTLHSCFSHAILDSCFPIFWIIDDLLKAEKIHNKNIRIFINEKKITLYPKQNLPMIDEVEQCYKGVFNEIIKLITPNPVFFQHLLKINYLFKHCIFYPDNDKWQRTPWNCVDYYPGRNVPRDKIRFIDTLIYEKLFLFRNHVFKKTKINISNLSTKKLMIIDRKYNRKIEPTKLEFLIQEAEKNKNLNFTRVTILEDMLFEEQINLFANHNVYIFRHGSCLIHLLWIPNNSIIFELEGGPNGIKSPMVIPRLCKLTNSKHILLNYNDYNCKNDIFKFLEEDSK